MTNMVEHGGREISCNKATQAARVVQAAQIYLTASDAN